MASFTTLVLNDHTSASRTPHKHDNHNYGVLESALQWSFLTQVQGHDVYLASCGSTPYFGNCPTLKQSIFEVIIRATYNDMINSIQLLQSGGSAQTIFMTRRSVLEGSDDSRFEPIRVGTSKGNRKLEDPSGVGV